MCNFTKDEGPSKAVMILKKIICYLERIIKWIFQRSHIVWFPPIFLSSFFWSSFLLSFKENVPFAYVLDYDTGYYSFGFGEKDAGQYLKIKQVPLPDSALLKLLKIPEEMATYKQCYSQKSYIFNIDEEAIPSNEEFTVSTGSTLITLKTDEPLCIEEEESLKMIGGRFTGEETAKRINSWGVDKKNPNRKELYGYFEITYRTWPKYFSLFVLLPLAITYLWWGVILLHTKIKNEFISYQK